MKIALYARVSSEKQAEKDLSIPAQLKALKSYALKHRWDVVREFVDEAESARTAKRPAFQEMIGLAKQKNPPFDAILVWKLSRFARNREDSILYKSLLRRHGVKVISMNEQIDNSPSGKLLEGIIEVIDEFYSTNLAQDTVRGMKENARRGSRNGSRPPFGYKTVKTNDGKTTLEIEEAEAPMVVKAFQWYLDGESVKEVARRLNENGHRTRSGARWGKPAVYNLLRNETYTGTFVWNRYSKANGRKVENPPEEVIRIPGHQPYLIDQTLFDKAQSLLRKRAPSRSHPKEVASVYLLSGLTRCKKCGSKMVVTTAKSGRFTYYICQKRLREGKRACDHRMINTGKLEAFVIEAIRDRILTEEHITELVSLVTDELRTRVKGAAVERRSIDKGLADIERRLSKLYRLIEDEKIEIDEAAPRLRELTAQREQLNAKRRRLERSAGASAPKAPAKRVIRRYVADLQDTLKHGKIVEQKAFIRSFVKRVEIDHPMAELYYTCPLTPPEGCKPLTEEVLDMVQNGSPGRTRTYNPAVNSRMLYH